MKKFTWTEMEEKVVELRNKLQKENFYPQILVSVLKGGLFPCTLLSYYFPNALLSSIRARHYGSVKFEVEDYCAQDLKGLDVLVVDDVIETGMTLRGIKEKLARSQASNIKYACLIQRPGALEIADFYSILSNEDISLPWYRFYKQAKEKVILL